MYIQLTLLSQTIVKLLAVIVVVASFGLLGYEAWKSRKREHIFVIGENEKHEIIFKVTFIDLVLDIMDVYVGVDGKTATHVVIAIGKPWTHWSWTGTVGTEEKHKVHLKLADHLPLEIELYVDDLLIKKEPVQK
jgi:hypothetical protein